MEPSTTAGFSHSMSMDTSVASGWKGRGSLVAAAAGITAVGAAAAADTRSAGIVVAEQEDQHHQQPDGQQDQEHAAATEAGLAGGRTRVAALEVAPAVLQP